MIPVSVWGLREAISLPRVGRRRTTVSDLTHSIGDEFFPPRQRPGSVIAAWIGICFPSSRGYRRAFLVGWGHFFLIQGGTAPSGWVVLTVFLRHFLRSQ